MEIWLVEFVKGLGRLFLHPLFYVGIFAAILIGSQRVKRERKDFYARVNDRIAECKTFLLSGIGYGLLFSLVTVGLGVVVTKGTLLFIGILAVILALTLQVRWLSPSYIVGLTILVTLFSPAFQLEGIFGWLNGLQDTSLFSLSVVLALMTIAEGFLILKNGSLHTSPQLVKGKRGKLIGVHESKRLWMVPLILFIPGDAIVSTFEWWPVIQVNEQAFSLALIPITVGFHQTVQSMLPKEAINATGRQVLLLSIVVTLLTIAAYWFPIVAVITAVTAIIGREAINFRQRIADDSSVSYFSKRETGVIILAVIPKSPAEKMSLKVGEIIKKVNGQTVRDEREFYEALQSNRAFCKLDVLDYNGEVRFVQRALYDGEHHELGLLFVHEEKEWKTEAV